jgi:putative flippase GtrA
MKKFYLANIKIVTSLITRHQRFIRFCVTGAISTLIDIGILAILVEIFKWPVILSNTLSFTAAAGNSFVINKYWTFENREKKYARQMSKFFLVALVGLALNNSLLYLFMKLGAWYLLAKIAVTVIGYSSALVFDALCVPNSSGRQPKGGFSGHGP